MKLSVQRRLNSQAGQQALSQRLGDYARYQDWLPPISRSRVLIHEGDISVVEIEAPDFTDRRISLECIHTGAGQWVLKQIGQAEGRGLILKVGLSPGERGGTDILADLELRQSWPGFGLRERITRALDQALASLDQSPARGDHATGAARRRLLLELQKTPEGISVSYLGRRFKTQQEAGE